MYGFRMNNCIRASDTKSSTGAFHSPDVHVPADGEGEALQKMLLSFIWPVFVLYALSF